MYSLNEKAKSIKPYVPVSGRLRIHLDANESFIELPEELRKRIGEKIEKLPLNRYPDLEAAEACAAFAGLYGVDKKSVVAGNGSDELISVIFNCFLEKGQSFATIEPDFSMYAFYGMLAEGKHVKINKNADFGFDVDNAIKICNNEAVRLLIFSNPCNPTSKGISAAEAARLISSVDALVVLDEAYMDFWDESMLSRMDEFDNLIILKTCSKAFGMAGIRMGFAAATQRLRDTMMAAKSPYNVNAVSQCIAAELLREKGLIEAALGQLLASKTRLNNGLLKLAEKTCAFKVISGVTNFVSIVMKDPEDFYEYLLGKGIAVRLTAGIIRVTCGTTEENNEFLSCAQGYFRGERIWNDVP